MCGTVGCAGIWNVRLNVEVESFRLTPEHKFAHLWDEVLVRHFPLEPCQCRLA